MDNTEKIDLLLRLPEKNAISAVTYMGNEKLTRFKPADIIVITGVLLLALYFIVPHGVGRFMPKELLNLLQISPGAKEERFKKLILINGSQVIDLPWKDDRIDLEQLINRKMIVEVKNGKARVVSSNCPDKICVHTGWVSECGHFAACLPNGVILLLDCPEN